MGVCLAGSAGSAGRSEPNSESSQPLPNCIFTAEQRAALSQLSEASRTRGHLPGQGLTEAIGCLYHSGAHKVAM
ncbi:unnamed protein product [Lampetra fluviatilis]